MLAYLVVVGSLPGEEALAGRRDVPGACTMSPFRLRVIHAEQVMKDVPEPHAHAYRRTQPTHVCLGLESTPPSSRTMPTPTLLAEPSMPSTSTMGFSRHALALVTAVSRHKPSALSRAKDMKQENQCFFCLGDRLQVFRVTAAAAGATAALTTQFGKGSATSATMTLRPICIASLE